LTRNIFGDKWGTPDVLVINKFPERKVFKPLIEIVSAEIKTDTNNLVTAFGQACAYKLFWELKYLCVLNLNTLSNFRRFCL
jgi:hypothetical protein